MAIKEFGYVRWDDLWYEFRYSMMYKQGRDSDDTIIILENVINAIEAGLYAEYD